MESLLSASEQQLESSGWNPCADSCLLAALPSLRVLSLPGLVQLSAAPSEPHLLRLEDGTETPGIGLIALQPGRNVIGPGQLFSVEFDPALVQVTATRLSEEDELHVNGVEVLRGESQTPHPLLPGSLIVSGRCLYQFCWSAHLDTIRRPATAGQFLSGRAEVASLRRENSDLEARARDHLEAADRADGLAVRVSAALGRLEAALFGGGSSGWQLEDDQQRNDSCSLSHPTAAAAASADDSPTLATLVRRCWAEEKASRHTVLLNAPEVHVAIPSLAGAPVASDAGSSRNLSGRQRRSPTRLQRRRRHCQLLMGVAADVGDKLVALLGGINQDCDQQWLFEGLCDLVAEIGWAMSLVD